MKWNKEDIEESFERMCNYISEGNSLNSALKLHDTPDKNTFYKWIDHTLLNEPTEDDIADCKRRFNQYTRATRERTEVLFEDMITLVEDREDVSYYDEAGNKRIDNAAVQAKRLEFQAKQWALSKMYPKKYGDRIDVTSKGEKINNAPPSQMNISLPDGTNVEDFIDRLKK